MCRTQLVRAPIPPKVGATVVLVTHHQQFMHLADTVMVFGDGHNGTVAGLDTYANLEVRIANCSFLLSNHQLNPAPVLKKLNFDPTQAAGMVVDFKQTKAGGIEVVAGDERDSVGSKGADASVDGDDPDTGKKSEKSEDEDKVRVSADNHICMKFEHFNFTH